MIPQHHTHAGPELRARSLKGERGAVAATAASDPLRNEGFREEEGLPIPLYSGIGNPPPPKTRSYKGAF